MLLLCSLTANYVLFSVAKQYYTELNSVRLDPLNLDAFPAQVAQSNQPATPKRVLFYGDSRAAQWPALPGQLEYLFLNRGIGTQTSAQCVLRFDEHVAPLRPDVVIIQVGINDLKSLPLFPQQEDAIVDAVKQNIHTLIDKSESVGAQVIVTTVFPVGNLPLARRLVWSPAINDALRKVNDYIHSLTSNNVRVFDSAAILSDGRGQVRQEYQFDTLHLNQAGYDALNQQLIEFLKQP